MIATDLTIAGRNLLQHTRRTFFLGGAIAAVTMLLVLLGGVTTGVRETMLRSATTLMTGHVNVGGFFKITSGMSAPLVSDAAKVLAEVKRNVPELDYATLRGRGYAKAVSDTGSMDMVLGGLDIDGEPGFREAIQVLDGSLDALRSPNTILIFQDQAKRLEVKVGDGITLSAPTARGMNNTADVRVGAIARNVGLLSAWNAYIPHQTLRALYQLRPDTTGAIHLYLKPGHVPESGAIAARLRTALAAAGWRVMEADPQPYYMKLLQKVNSEDWVGQKLDMSTWEDEVSFMAWILRALQAISGLLIGVLMVIVVVGIMNTMWIAIRERTREIGTLRAIGMHRRKVMWLFLLEAAILGAAGTAGGALLGAGVAALVNSAHLAVPEGVQMFLMSTHLGLAVHVDAVVRGAVGITVATALAALYPAVRAARLRPVTAMHHIG